MSIKRDLQNVLTTVIISYSKILFGKMPKITKAKSSKKKSIIINIGVEIKYIPMYK